MWPCSHGVRLWHAHYTRPTQSEVAVDGEVMDRAMRLPAAVSWGPGRVDLFWLGEANDLWHRTMADGVWAQPESLGGTLASGPAVTAWGGDRMQVFAIFPDGQLWDRYWDGQAWHAWKPLGGDLVGQPASSSWGDDRLDVFALGRDGALWHRWWDGTQWVPWESMA